MIKKYSLFPGILLLLSACNPVEHQPLGGPTRHEIRPTDGDGHLGNGYGNVPVAHFDTPGGKFRIHYPTEGRHRPSLIDADNDGAPDFVESYGEVFDNVYKKEVTEMGFRPPLDDSKYHDRPDYGGDGRFDVYLQDTLKASGYYVVEACVPAFPFICSGYMVVENDFAGYPFEPKVGMEILASHEFFHAVQATYRINLSENFSEATAVWMTEQLYPQHDDFEGFVPYFFDNPQRPLDYKAKPGDLFPYGTTMWPTFLAERYEQKVIQAILEELSEKGGSTEDLIAVDKVLARDHKSSLAEAFADFALWNLMTGKRAAGYAGYKSAAKLPELKVEVQKQQSLPLRVSGTVDHLASRYYRISVPKGTWIRVTSERLQPELALHLVTWPQGAGKAPVVASAPYDDKGTFAEIQSPGEVFIVAASTVLEKTNQPLSLAVTQIQAPVGPNPPPPPPEETGDDDSGCSVAGNDGGPLTMALLLLLPLLLLRRRGHLLPLLLVALVACDDETSETTDGRSLVDASLPDLTLPDQTVEPDGPIPMAVGEIADFDADGQGMIRGSTPTSGSGTEGYLLLLLSRDPTPLKVHSYTAAAVQKTSSSIDTAPHDAKTEGDRPRSFVHRCTFHQRLKRLLASNPRRFRKPKLYHEANQPPKVGDTHDFAISDGQGKVVTITAEAIHVDGTAVFWIDRTTTPLASITPQTLQQLSDGFSQIVVPRERIYFGQESDINSDGLIAVLFSKLVKDTGATAYFSPCDLVDPKLVPGCDKSNGMELLYMTPPSSLQPPMNSPIALLEVVAHELQHAIFFHRKYLLHNNVGALANAYITEGLSHLAEDLAGYQAGNYFMMQTALENVDLLSVPNMTDKAISSYVPGQSDGVMRGGSYLLLRYLFDLAGGDKLDGSGMPVDAGGIAWLRAFVDAKEIGDVNYEKTTQLTREQLFEQFWTTIAVSNRGPAGAPINAESKYNFAPTIADPLTGLLRGCDLYASFFGMIQLSGPMTRPIGSADGKLRGGGAEFLTLNAVSGEHSVGFEVKAPLEAKAWVRLIRIK